MNPLFGAIDLGPTSTNGRPRGSAGKRPSRSEPPECETFAKDYAAQASGRWTRPESADAPETPPEPEASPPGSEPCEEPKYSPEQQARIIGDGVFSSHMAAVVDVPKHVDGLGCGKYLDQILRDAGSSTDPIERMLVQQLAAAHLRIGSLHAQSATAQKVDVNAAGAFNSAAAHLMAEFRRGALALASYREVSRTRSTKPEPTQAP